MMMLKQSPSRNLRGGRGYKVKHVAQMCLMLMVALWMLHQVRHCYPKKAVLAGREEKVVVKLGRKGLLPGVVEEEDQDEEPGKGDEFEQVDDLMEEIEEQDMEESPISEDSVAESFTTRNETGSI